MLTKRDDLFTVEKVMSETFDNQVRLQRVQTALGCGPMHAADLIVEVQAVWKTGNDLARYEQLRHEVRGRLRRIADEMHNIGKHSLELKAIELLMKLDGLTSAGNVTYQQINTLNQFRPAEFIDANPTAIEDAINAIKTT